MIVFDQGYRTRDLISVTAAMDMAPPDAVAFRPNTRPMFVCGTVTNSLDQSFDASIFVSLVPAGFVNHMTGNKPS